MSIGGKLGIRWVTFTLCRMMEPQEAYARFKLGAISVDRVVELSHQWMCNDIYTDSILDLSEQDSPVRSEIDLIFQQVLSDLNIDSMNRIEAGRFLLRVTLQSIVDMKVDPVKEAEFIYWRIHHELDDEFPDKKYVGDSLGLEHIFCWLREVWDCRDGSIINYYADLPRNEAEMKFVEHLVESASDWLKSNT